MLSQDRGTNVIAGHDGNESQASSVDAHADHPGHHLRHGLAEFLIALSAISLLAPNAAAAPAYAVTETRIAQVRRSDWLDKDDTPGASNDDALDLLASLHGMDASRSTQIASRWEQGLVHVNTYHEYKTLLRHLADLAFRKAGVSRDAVDLQTMAAVNAVAFIILDPQEARELVEAGGGKSVAVDHMASIVLQASAGVPSLNAPKESNETQLDVLEEIASTQREIADALKQSQTTQKDEKEWLGVLAQLTPVALAGALLKTAIDAMNKGVLSAGRRFISHAVEAGQRDLSRATSEEQIATDITSSRELARSHARDTLHDLLSQPAPAVPRLEDHPEELLALAFKHDLHAELTGAMSTAAAEGIADVLAQRLGHDASAHLSRVCMESVESLVDRLV